MFQFGRGGQPLSTFFDDTSYDSFRHEDSMQVDCDAPNNADSDSTERYDNPRLNPVNFLEGPLSCNPATRLRQMLARPGIVVAPGICDGISTRCALEAGFDCLYQSGAAMTASRLGQADFSLATLSDYVESAETVTCLSPSTPLIVDADSGIGGPIQIERAICQFHRVGVAALHIEDQVQNKCCEHLHKKDIVSRIEFVTRIRAAVQARDSIAGGSDLVIIARTDCVKALGLDEAIVRMRLAAGAGADVLYVEGISTKEELQATVAALSPKPVLLNAISRGPDSSITCDEAEHIGAKIIVFSLVSAIAALQSIRAAMNSLKKTGTDFVSAQGMDPKAFFEIMGMGDIIKFDAAAGGSSFTML